MPQTSTGVSSVILVLLLTPYVSDDKDAILDETDRLQSRARDH